ncbi:LysR family transcriptional regulator [Stagnimonas aquatica]|uniref:LysR family transcriptional regulator n=1 Tax=Stagnimonas aquatica TaxID=2689987 RepID=A0A3N0VLE5_9GAMM|nr:LysR family transcriptional regulator [Stagnimonas aquatica]ROH93534.1 LysR family transcriptional regulator [Stagnimonas aquatica]
MNPRISLEQWRALMAVVDAGGYAQAAEQLHKSQSAVTYAVQKLESLLSVKAFEVQGRKAVLTPTGQLLYRRARALLAEASRLEQAASALAAGWEAEIRLAVEVVFPTWLLLRVLDRFGQDSPHTRIELSESVLGGTSEALLQGRVDLAIAPVVPPGFFGEPLMQMYILPMAHPDHPLHHLGRPLKPDDLRQHRHIVVRDSGSRRDESTLTIDAQQRWTVSNMPTSIHALCQGYGFAWMPLDKIRNELRDGLLKPLPLEGQERRGTLYLIFADHDYAGRGTLRLAELLREMTAAECAARVSAPSG